jgi:SAM-dependent methyltransferase
MALVTARVRRLLAALAAALAVGHAAADEVPFITTPDHVTLAMLELAGVRAGDTVLDLGSGDGRIPITAAKRFGARGLGVEIVPDLVAKSRANARQAGVADRVQFFEQDLFATDLTVASVVTMYLLPEVNLQLRPKLLALAPGTRIVSHDFDLADWAPDASVVLDVPEKTIGLEKKSRLMRWTVPAPLDGTWCSADGRHRLQIRQRFQQVEAEAASPAASARRRGAIDGVVLTLVHADGTLALWRWVGDTPARLEPTQATGAWSAWREPVLRRAGAAGCPP